AVTVQAPVLAQQGRAQLPDRPRPRAPAPVLLLALDPRVDLAHQRLHPAARERQPRPPVLGVLPPPLVVPAVAQRRRRRAPRVRRWQLLPRRRPPHGPLPVLQLLDHLRNPALPTRTQPPHVLVPALDFVGRQRPRRPVHAAQNVQEVRDRREDREPPLLQLPVVRPPVRHERLPRGPVEGPLLRLPRRPPPDTLAPTQPRHPPPH